jgi:hypothetical protein
VTEENPILSKVTVLQAAIRQLINQGKMNPGMEEKIVEEVLDGDHQAEDRENKPTPENYGGRN